MAETAFPLHLSGGKAFKVQGSIDSEQESEG
jgi:hypothetical protein